MKPQWMTLHATERDYYSVTIAVNPPMAGAWEASFDDGATWVVGDQAGSVWSWLVAGPQFNASAVGMSPTDTDATITAQVTPLLRLKDSPVSKIETGPTIYVKSP